MVHSGVQVGHPGSGIQKTDIGNDSPVSEDFYRQVAGGEQTVGYGIVVEQVQDLNLLVEDDFPDRLNIPAVEFGFEFSLDDWNLGFCQPIQMGGCSGAHHC